MGLAKKPALPLGRPFLAVVAALLFLAPLTLWAHAGGEAAAMPETEASPPGGDFTLTSAKGPVSLRDFRGRLVLLSFGYTQCSDVCPMTLSAVAAALKRLDEKGRSRVQPLFVTVDPERDTPRLLAEYVGNFDQTMLGLTGSPHQIAAVARLYGVKHYKVEIKGSSSGHAINHSASLYLIDGKGALRFVFPHNTPTSVVTEAIRHLLRKS